MGNSRVGGKVTLLLAVLAMQAAPANPPFVNQNSPTSQRYPIETMTGGVALLDFNGDGRLDVFLVNGGKLDDPHRAEGFSRSDPRYWNRLYRQKPNGEWEDATQKSGLHRAGDGNYGMGVATGDFDNDGDADLYITNFGRNQLFRNNGNGTFTDITESAGVPGGGWSVSAVFVDYDRDGLLDLFVGRYLEYTIAGNKLCGEPVHAYCRPGAYPPITNLLFRNLGNGKFEDVSERSGIGAYPGTAMGVAAADFDGDGWQDLFVANDSMEQWLFRNRHDGTFEEVALDAGLALSGEGKPFAGMGAAVADYDNDGLLDLAVTNLAFDKFALFRALGGGSFESTNAKTGLAGLTVMHTGWGVAWIDYDNDGYRDLLCAQGHVLDNVAQFRAGLSYREQVALYRNVKGRFEKTLLGEPIAGRGLATGDLDNDGTVEAVINALGGAPVIVRPPKTANHWLGVKLVGRKSPRDGQGAIVRAAGQTALASTSGSYLSASDPRVHFGLGSATETDVTIEWPSGQRQKIENVRANQWIEAVEP